MIKKIYQTGTETEFLRGAVSCIFTPNCYEHIRSCSKPVETS